MLDILSFLLNLIEQHSIWLFVACLALMLFHIRSFAVAKKDRRNTPYTIEREVAAHREGRAISGIGAALGLAAVVTALKFLVVPSLDIAKIIEPTPTLTLPAPTVTFVAATMTPESAATPGDEDDETSSAPTGTPEPSPTADETPEPTATPEPQPVVPANCPDQGVQIVSPGMGATVSGQVAIVGTASIDRFQFFKIEYAIGEQPGAWQNIGDLQYAPVVNGVLGSVNTASLPNGMAWLQLTVVDETGNFPAPCRVRLVISN